MLSFCIFWRHSTDSWSYFDGSLSSSLRSPGCNLLSWTSQVKEHRLGGAQIQHGSGPLQLAGSSDFDGHTPFSYPCIERQFIGQCLIEGARKLYRGTILDIVLHPYHRWDTTPSQHRRCAREHL